jgi:hypothetical protein
VAAEEGTQDMQLQSTRGKRDRDLVRKGRCNLRMVQEDANSGSDIRDPTCDPPGVGAHFVARESVYRRDTRCSTPTFTGREASSWRIESSLARRFANSLATAM